MIDVSSWRRQPVSSVLIGVGLVAAGAALSQHCRRIVIHGTSMLPSLEPGDRLIVMPAWNLRAGQLVVVGDPRRPERLMVKRVEAVDHGAATVSLRGDNPAASTDSRTFGPVRRETIVGKAVYRYFPSTRVGWLHPQ